LSKLLRDSSLGFMIQIKVCSGPACACRSGEFPY
jgi:hypothetical protein